MTSETANFTAEERALLLGRIEALQRQLAESESSNTETLRDAQRYRVLATIENNDWVKFHFQASGFLKAYGPVQAINRKPWLDEAVDAILAGRK